MMEMVAFLLSNNPGNICERCDLCFDWHHVRTNSPGPVDGTAGPSSPLRPVNSASVDSTHWQFQSLVRARRPDAFTYLCAAHVHRREIFWVKCMLTRPWLRRSVPSLDGVQATRWCSRRRKTKKATGLRTFRNEPPIQRLILPSGAAIVLTHPPPPLWSWFPHFLCCSLLRWVAAGDAADKWSKKGGTGCVREIDGKKVVSLKSFFFKSDLCTNTGVFFEMAQNARTQTPRSWSYGWNTKCKSKSCVTKGEGKQEEPNYSSVNNPSLV